MALTTPLQFDPLRGHHFTNGGHGPAVEVTKVHGGPAQSPFLALVYQCPLIEDIDGAPRAYGWDRPGHPLQQHLHPYENGSPHHPSQQVGLANAADPWQALWHNNHFAWAGLYSATPHFAHAHGLVIDDRPQLRDRHGRYPVVQPQGAPAPGYYVSTTARAANPHLPNWDQRRYWDASAVPYAVYAIADWAGTGLALGDYGLAIRLKTGTYSGFFFADTRRHGVGECSRYLVRSLSHAGPESDPVSFIVFPGSGNGSPSGAAQRHIHGILVKRLSALSASGANPGDLVQFLALGAHRHRYEQLKRRSVVIVDNKTETLQRVLSRFGVTFPLIGDFPNPSWARATV